MQAPGVSPILGKLLLITFLALVTVAAPAVPRDSTRSTDTNPIENEAQAAFDAAQAVMKRGPAEIKMTDQALLQLPEGFVFVPAHEAGRIMKSMGNSVGEGFLGMIFPGTDENANWFVVAYYHASGYIKDDDAKDWNADEMLENLVAGTEETNKDRKARGIPEVQVIGWVEKPHYDPAAHRLVWSVSTKDKGAPDSDGQGINYNTYALGREGYISLNLVTDLKSIEAQKPIARTLLGSLDFNQGKQYAEFNSSTDKVAAYGLAALVGGIAAKKLGLLALAAAFVAKSAKAIIAAGVAVAVAVAKRRKRNKAADTSKA